jgi:hypothetical protein
VDDGLDMDGADMPDEMTDDELDNESEGEEGAMQPEDIPLQLPSTLGPNTCTASGKKDLMDQEVELRRGQASDALSQLRAAIGYKSFLFKEKGRNPQNYEIGTRSKSTLKTVEQGIQQNVTAYNLAFNALTRLGFTGEFRAIKKTELQVNANIYKANRYGASKHTVSWIWRTGEPSKNAQNEAWMQEGKCFELLQCSNSQDAH